MISREQALATLKRTWRTEELKFYAEFFRPKKEDGSLIKPRPGVNAFGFFRNLSINDRKIVYPTDEVLKYDRNVSFKIDALNGLEDGKYYYLELELEDDEKRVLNPYALRIKDVFILEEDHLSPKKFIEQWFYKKGHTPGDASTIAGQLTLNELELYTHTKRFIFELIQNADDMPDGNRDVNIEINLLPNHLLFLHNGKFFDREDVKAISDAAKSTKSKSLSQTGYKGIGFKSVFTDSTRVYIKSGDYFFKFDKLEPIYKDFYRLYKGYSDNLTPKAKKEFEIEYKGREKEFTLIDKIPWQIKPIWVEPSTLPQELSSSHFLKNRQVSIALEISENILSQKDYHGMILGLLREPRFLLFLRNTKGFRYSKIFDQYRESIIDISVKEKNDIIGVFSNEVLIASYIKHEFTISITNEDFTKAGLNFQKREIEGGKIEFFDNNGNKLDNIPEKLGRLDKTIITLSAKMDKYAIEKLDKEDSILFNYLPTSDQRFGFPFLVNADFVSKTDREFIQIENKWNHYLFYHLGQKCIEWIAILSNITHEINGKKLFSYAKTYLNLLPNELLDEDNEELKTINIAFNKGLRDAIQVTSLVIDSYYNKKRCDEIILDDTLIAEVLGNVFFKELSKTKKELPFFILDIESLRKDYLNIERYKAETLITEIAKEPNKLLLKRTIVRLKPDKYLEFLKWLNTFCKLNNVENDWILDLPIIRINETSISLRESLGKSDFFIRMARTIVLEPLLNNIGFTLSEFSIDNDNFQNIKAVILQQESYLKTDLKLYEHIAAANGLSNLTAAEKNTLITFFGSLVDVGPAKYAKALPLFKSKKKEGSLKPLNSLISNTCAGLPTWLNDFVIDADEENSLDSTFKAHLLKEKDFLEKLFCNLESYNEIIANINSKNIEEFYTYILKLNINKPDETKIDFSVIPLVFIDESSKFILVSTTYWAESLTKLTLSKYESVKSVIETISDEMLPNFAALQIKAPFALGGKELNLVEITPKTNSLDVLAINDFLDWVEANGEKEFLNHFSFSVIDEKLSIEKSSGSKYYYTTDESLIAFIEASAINTKLSLFPKELYSKDRNKIGLLEGVPLLTYLIENGLANVELVKFVQSANETQLSLQYLELLSELNIDSSKSYTAKDDEFKILKLVTTQIIDDSEKLDSFREKVSLDNVKLLEKAVSADIRMYDENKKFQYQLKTLELSHVLPQYSGKTYPVSEIIELFIEFRDNESLKKVFRAKPRYTETIFKELIELKKEVYNAAQTFFLSYYQFLFPSETILNDKNFFAINPEIDREAYEKELTQFLDYCLNENGYIEFISQEIIQSFFPKNIVSSEDYAIDDEKIPTWLSNWIYAGDSDKKKAFIKSLGVNDDESHVVLYRKAIKESQMETMDFNRENIDTDSLLINTLKWLSKELNSKQLTLSKEVLQPLYKTLSNRGISIENLPFPSLKYYNIDSYSLQTIKEGDEIHIINENWGEFKEAIFTYLIKDQIITDDVLPKAYRDEWNVIEQAFEKLPNVEDLVAKSYVYNEEFYQEWDLKNQYNIQVYKGEKIPYLINYNGCLIKEISEGFAVYISNAYYIVESVKVNPFTFLSQLPEFKDIQSLRAQKQLFEEKKLETEGGITFTPEQIEAWHALFDNDIPESYKKNYNLASLVAALEALPKFGYAIDKARTNLKETHEYAQLDPVFDSDGNVYTVMSRSARGGLLYLTRKAWDRLESEPNTFLFADYGNGKSNLFKSKQDILDVNEKHTDYQILRIETEAVASNVDSILNGTFDNSKIWIIFRVNENKEFDRLYYKDYEPSQGEVDTANLRNSTEINTW